MLREGHTKYFTFTALSLDKTVSLTMLPIFCRKFLMLLQLLVKMLYKKSRHHNIFRKSSFTLCILTFSSFLNQQLKRFPCMLVTLVGGNYKYMHSRNSPSFDRLGTDRRVISASKVIRLLVNNLRFTCLGNFIATVKY